MIVVTEIITVINIITILLKYDGNVQKVNTLKLFNQSFILKTNKQN